jgi:hypothetical protein
MNPLIRTLLAVPLFTGPWAFGATTASQEPLLIEDEVYDRSKGGKITLHTTTAVGEPTTPEEQPIENEALEDDRKTAVNTAIGQAKLAQVSAIRELANLLACPKIDPQKRPSLYSYDTQMYYFGRIFQAYRNVNLKVLKGLTPSEISIVQKQLSEEGFTKGLMDTLNPLFNSPKIEIGSQNDLSKLSESSAMALQALFADSSGRLRTDTQVTLRAIEDGSLFKEKPGATLRRGTSEISPSPHHAQFSEFFSNYASISKVLYVGNERPRSLSPAGLKLCQDLDSNKKQHERWEEPKIEDRVDKTEIDAEKAKEVFDKVAEEQKAGETLNAEGIINPDVLSAPTIEQKIIPEVHSGAALGGTGSTPPSKPQASAGFENLDQKVRSAFPDITGPGFVFEQTQDILTATDEITARLVENQMQILRKFGLDTPKNLAHIEAASFNADKTPVTSPREINKEKQARISKIISDELTKLKSAAINAEDEKEAAEINNRKVELENARSSDTASAKTAHRERVTSVYAKRATDRWNAIASRDNQKPEGQKLTDRQKYYLAWAANIMTKPAEQDREHDLIIGSNLGVGDNALKQFTPSDLVRFAQDRAKDRTSQNLAVECFFCTQPLRNETEQKQFPDIQNSELGEAILSSGGRVYMGIDQLTPEDHSKVPSEVLYNLSVAMNYLSAGSENAVMPELLAVPETFQLKPPAVPEN